MIAQEAPKALKWPSGCAHLLVHIRRPPIISEGKGQSSISGLCKRFSTFLTLRSKGDTTPLSSTLDPCDTESEATSESCVNVATRTAAAHYPPAQNQYMQEKFLGELIFARIHTLRVQRLKIFKILEFSSEIENFKRATHQTPILCGEF